MGTLSESPKPGPVAAGPAAAGNHEEAPIKRLTRPQFWGCLLIALTIFALSTGPLWKHPWDIGVLNVAIWVSYIPLPLMVIGCLAYNRGLTLRGFFLDTLVLTLLKYSITFMFALAMWAVSPEPQGQLIAHGARIPITAAEPTPAPSVVDPASTGTLQGVIMDSSGQPVRGALVFIESGLEKFVFDAPTAPLDLENNGAGVTPRVAVARLRQPVQARASDGRLHTFIATKKDGVALLNAPLLSSGAWSPVRLREAGFVATIHCSVHQRSGAEAPSYLAVLDHPFYAITEVDGRFRFNGVPAGSMRVAAFHPDLGEGAGEAKLEPGASPEITVSLRKPE